MKKFKHVEVNRTTERVLNWKGEYGFGFIRNIKKKDICIENNFGFYLSIFPLSFVNLSLQILSSFVINPYSHPGNNSYSFCSFVCIYEIYLLKYMVDGIIFCSLISRGIENVWSDDLGDYMSYP